MAIAIDDILNFSLKLEQSTPEELDAAAMRIGGAWSLEPGDSDRLIQTFVQGPEGMPAVTPPQAATFANASMQGLQAKFQPPPTPEAAEVSKGETKSFFEKLKGNTPALMGLANFGAILAQGPKRLPSGEAEPGIAGMLGRAIQGGVEGYSTGAQIESKRRAADRREALDVADLSLRAQELDLKKKKAGKKPETKGFYGQVKALQGELQKLNSGLSDAEAFAKASEIYTAYKTLGDLDPAQMLFATDEDRAAIEAQIKQKQDAIGSMVRDAAGITPKVEGEPAPMPVTTEQETPIMDSILKGLGHMITGPSRMYEALTKDKGEETSTTPREKEIPSASTLPGHKPATEAQIPKSDPVALWTQLMQLNGNPSEGTPKYQSILNAVRSMHPGFSPTGGQVQR